MHGILIPTDFTERSRSTIKYVVEVFPPATNRYILFHSRSSSSSNEILVSIDDILDSNIQKNLKAEVDYVKSIAGDQAKVEVTSDNGDFLSAINRSVDKTKADLVALGSKGERTWYGESSNEEDKTVNIIRGINISSLLVPISEYLKNHARFYSLLS